MSEVLTRTRTQQSLEQEPRTPRGGIAFTVAASPIAGNENLAPSVAKMYPQTAAGVQAEAACTNRAPPTAKGGFLRAGAGAGGGAVGGAAGKGVGASVADIKQKACRPRMGEDATIGGLSSDKEKSVDKAPCLQDMIKKGMFVFTVNSKRVPRVTKCLCVWRF